jgi:hypothetical protein
VLAITILLCVRYRIKPETRAPAAVPPAPIDIKLRVAIFNAILPEFTQMLSVRVLGHSDLEQLLLRAGYPPDHSDSIFALNELREAASSAHHATSRGSGVAEQGGAAALLQGRDAVDSPGDGCEPNFCCRRTLIEPGVCSRRDEGRRVFNRVARVARRVSICAANFVAPRPIRAMYYRLQQYGFDLPQLWSCSLQHLSHAVRSQLRTISYAG